MTEFELIEDGEVVGYVDTESLEYEYAGEDSLVESALEDLGTSLGMSADDLYGTEVFLEGEEADEYIHNMGEDEITDITVRVKDNV